MFAKEFQIDMISTVQHLNVEDHYAIDNYGFEGIGHYLKQIGRIALLNAEEERELASRIEAGLYSAYHLARLKEAGVSLPVSLRRDLTWVARDGRRSKTHLIEANLRLVVSLAKRYQHRGLGLLDLVQHGNLGLIRAVEKFDYKTGHKFSTYATWWIRQAIVRGIFNEARMIRLPVHIEESLAKINRAEAALDHGTQSQAAKGIIAAEVDMSEIEINELRDAARNVYSLEWLVHDADSWYSDLFDDDDIDVVEVISRDLVFDLLESVVNTLEPREAGIVRLRNGFGLMRPAEREEVAQVYGVTTERIRQLEAKAMSKLRHPSRSDVLKEYL